MSYAIYYDKRVFKVGEDKYVAMISSGDNNCWQCSYPRDIPSKDWTPIRLKNRVMLSKEEILNILEGSEKWDVAKARGNFFKDDEFKRWILAGVKNAITLEEAVSYSIFNQFRIFSEKSGSYEYIKTTSELVERLTDIEKNEEDVIISLDCRDFTPKKRSRSIKDKVEQDHYFVIKIYSLKNVFGGYFVKKKKYGYKYTLYKDYCSVRKFKTEKLASKYAETLTSSISNCKCEIERVNKVASF